jgi:hypothetical protein
VTLAGRLRRGLPWLACGIAALWSPAVPAAALRYCDSPAEASPAEQDRLLRVGALIKAELEASGQRVALIARSGLDLSRFGVRYSHAGVSLQASPNTPWSVRQLYYACDEQRPRLFDQGLAGFLLGVDDPALGYISMVILPEAESAALERTALDRARALSLLGGTYSANAHPQSLRYQNCNQWLVELLALARGAAPAPAERPAQAAAATNTAQASAAQANAAQANAAQASAAPTGAADAVDPPTARPAAQQWLQQHGYQGSAITLRNPLLWLAPAVVPWLHTDDHPPEELQRGIVTVSLPSSIEAWLRDTVPGARRIELCHTEREVVIRRGWAPLPEGCRAEDGDTVIAFDS